MNVSAGQRQSFFEPSARHQAHQGYMGALLVATYARAPDCELSNDWQHADCFRQAGDPLAAELANASWLMLLSGSTILAHAVWGERRFVLTRPCGVDRSLREREQSAAKLAVSGRSTKYIAYELGVGVSSASRLVSSVIKKLGLRSRAELTEIFGMMGGLRCDVSAHNFRRGEETYTLFETPAVELRPPETLTDAERDVVLGVLSGKSNSAIALSRQTSTNTVANQLRAVYLKLGISGRAELISACQAARSV